MSGEEKKVICYYHNDMDGIASASIVKKVYPDAEFYKVDYGDDWDIDKVINTMVIVVDFSFDNMDLLKKSCKLLCWIDHHKTAMEKNFELWNSEDIDGFRQLDKSGCELTWEWFFPHEPTPRAIELIGDRDMWKFKYGEDTRAYHEQASMIYKSPCTSLLVSGSINQFLLKGGVLLMKKKEQVRKAFEQGITVEFEGHKTRLMNTNVNTSETGEYCYKDKNFPIALIWSVREGNVICSLRSNTIDVSEIAKKYGGGGHKYAAGFPGYLKFIQKLMEDKDE